MARGKTDEILKAECIRLRVDDRMSLTEIHRKTGVSKSTMSAWLRQYPLTEAELQQRQKNRKRYRAPKKDRGQQAEVSKLTGFLGALSKSQKGAVSEAAILFRLSLVGCEVFGSPFDGAKEDWVVSVPPEGRLIRVQVKSVTSGQYGLPYVPLRCTEGHNTARRYQEGDFDFVVGYDLFTDTAYVWSWDEVRHLKTTVTICPEAAEAWHKLKPV